MSRLNEVPDFIKIPCDPDTRPRVGDLVDMFVNHFHDHDVGHSVRTTQHIGRCFYLGRRSERNGTGRSIKLDVFWGPSGIFSCPSEDESWSGTIVSLLKDFVR